MTTSASCPKVLTSTASILWLGRTYVKNQFRPRAIITPKSTSGTGNACCAPRKRLQDRHIIPRHVKNTHPFHQRMPPNLPEAKWGHEMVTVKEKIRNRNALVKLIESLCFTEATLLLEASCFDSETCCRITCCSVFIHSA